MMAGELRSQYNCGMQTFQSKTVQRLFLVWVLKMVPVAPSSRMV